MKYSILLLCSTLTFAACNNASKTDDASTTPKDTITTIADKPAPSPMPDSAKQMENWGAYMTPGDMHKMMASWNGTWIGEVTSWHSPDSPPMSSKTTTTNKMVMGGRYQQSSHSGNMMDMPFEGLSTLAYDNNTKKFISTWIDNMGTGMMVLSGPWDEASNSMTLTGKMVNPAAGDGREQDIREVFKVIDDNNQVMEMYCKDDPNSQEYKIMEIKFTRKK